MTNLWVKKRLIKTLVKEMSKHFPNETGGVLAGYIGENDEKVVTQISVAGPKAKHNRYSYTPDHKFDEKQIARIYQESKRTEVYLGDWHSHPGAGAYLSEKDKATLQRIARYKKARIVKPIMIIMGTMPYELKAWEYSSEPFTELKLNLF
jgi:integrative and conjugative element protein (TIGR02256 family)